MLDPNVALPEVAALHRPGNCRNHRHDPVRPFRNNPNVVNLLAIRLALALVYVAAVMAGVQIMLVLWLPPTRRPQRRKHMSTPTWPSCSSSRG